MHVMKALTIREVDAQLARALEKEKKRRGASLNQTVLQLLRQALGLDSPGIRSNALAKLAGTWSEEDLSRFERDTAVFEQVDAEIWKR
jgi:DNA polymerase III delta subunit